MSTVVAEKDIMLADDDLEDVEIFELALKELSYPHVLRRAENGDVLFVLLKERIPYILFLDINLPCKDGVACIVEIRKYREYDHLPVIMYTSFFSDQYISETYRGGANFYLTKANTLRELTAKLQKVFAIDWKDYLHFPPRDQFVLS